MSTVAVEMQIALGDDKTASFDALKLYCAVERYGLLPIMDALAKYCEHFASAHADWHAFCLWARYAAEIHAARGKIREISQRKPTP